MGRPVGVCACARRGWGGARVRVGVSVRAWVLRLHIWVGGGLDLVTCTCTCGFVLHANSRETTLIMAKQGSLLPRRIIVHNLHHHQSASDCLFLVREHSVSTATCRRPSTGGLCVLYPAADAVPPHPGHPPFRLLRAGALLLRGVRTPSDAQCQRP